MNKRNKAIIVLGVVVIGLVTLRYCEKKQVDDTIINAPVLKADEKEKIIIDTDKKKVTRIRRDGDKQVVDIGDGVRKVVITDPKDGGDVRVDIINKGFCFEPGLTLYYSDKARLGIDVQAAYWKQWGVLLGAGVNMGDEPRTVRIHVGINRALPFDFIDNTTVFIGVDNRKDAVVGLRIRF